VSENEEVLNLGTDEKTERLLNLVIALLGTRSYMKKSQIIKEIPGYSGSIEARERMFERDKEELRKIRIPIEVSSLDPLFDDEQGYRIVRSEYGFQLGNLSSEEYLVINAAFELMRSKVESKNIRALRRRILAASSATEIIGESIVNEIRHGMDLPDGRVVDVFLAIRERRRIAFSYQGEAVGPIGTRVISPRAIGRKSGEWFVIGFDHEKKGMRTFNLFQILGDIEPVEGDFNEQEFDFKQEFAGVHKQLHEVIVRVENQYTPFFEEEGGEVIKAGDVLSEIAFQTPNTERLLRILLSLSARFEVLSPETVRGDLDDLRMRLINGR